MIVKKKKKTCAEFCIFPTLFILLCSLLILSTWLTQKRNVKYDPSLVALYKTWLKSAEIYVASIHDQIGNGGIVTEQASLYLDIARNASVVCETGFFKGVSAHLFLSANNNLVMHSFDKHFPKGPLNMLHKMFGIDRFITHQGSTSRTLRHFRPNAPCDIVSIDGSHKNWDPYYDLLHLLPNIRCNATVLFDDAFYDRTVNKTIDNNPIHWSFYNFCTRSYWRLIREGILEHILCTEIGFQWQLGAFPKGFCKARVLCH